MQPNFKPTALAQVDKDKAYWLSLCLPLVMITYSLDARSDARISRDGAVEMTKSFTMTSPDVWNTYITVSSYLGHGMCVLK